LVLTASKSVRSFSHLREVIAYASFDLALWELLQQPTTREQVIQTLLVRYFPLTRHLYRRHAGQEQLDIIAGQMLHETAATYRRHVDLTDEPDQFVRSTLFVRQVLSAYDHTCAVSGLKLISTTGNAAPLLDACHIVPWAVSHDDTLPNGLPLCPNLHRAFDRHLFWIDTDYRVQVADHFSEFSGSDYGISRFQGQQLHLPTRRNLWPRVGNLVAQRGATVVSN
jgi:putative restriction endonuclease